MCDYVRHYDTFDDLTAGLADEGFKYLEQVSTPGCHLWIESLNIKLGCNIRCESCDEIAFVLETFHDPKHYRTWLFIRCTGCDHCRSL